MIRLEEARRADANLLARKASEEEVTPASSVPDLKVIVSVSLDGEVETCIGLLSSFFHDDAYRRRCRQRSADRRPLASADAGQRQR